MSTSCGVPDLVNDGSRDLVYSPWMTGAANAATPDDAAVRPEQTGVVLCEGRSCLVTINHSECSTRGVEVISDQVDPTMCAVAVPPCHGTRHTNHAPNVRLTQRGTSEDHNGEGCHRHSISRGLKRTAEECMPRLRRRLPAVELSRLPLRDSDLNRGPRAYETHALPNCAIPQCVAGVCVCIPANRLADVPATVEQYQDPGPV